MRGVLSSVFMLLAVACGGSTSADRPAGAGGGAGTDAGTGGSAGSGGATGCSGSAPMCADGCGSDWFPETAFCSAGKWKCPGHTVLPEDCPPGTCWGLPLPGESCGPSGWQCTPTAEQVKSCPSLMCATCNGLSGPLITTDCQCSCENGQVTCAPVAFPSCDIIQGFCECWGRIDCEPVTDTCLCPCDYQCPGEPPCDCACGGGQFLGCKAK